MWGGGRLQPAVWGSHDTASAIWGLISNDPRQESLGGKASVTGRY